MTFAIYQGLCMRRLTKQYVEGKFNNAPGVNLRQNVAFACTPSLLKRVIIWLEGSNQKASTWSAINFKKSM